MDMDRLFATATVTEQMVALLGLRAPVCLVATCAVICPLIDLVANIGLTLILD